MFQFKDLIHAGMESASNVERNRKSIDEVFSSLNNELHKETEGLISIKRYIRTPNVFEDIANTYNMVSKGMEPVLSIESKENTGTLNIVINNGGNAPVARWDQHPDGYPFTIEFLGERTDCWDQEALVNALGKIVVSGQLWLKVKELQLKPPKESNKK
ncbi:hypothetical protein AB6848_20525 [Serratia proteamaculans]|uniref:hypothetical protein n=1 Tax=Serratia proteamaculans TaxID=28151 RepID=UPI0039BE4E25